MKKKMSLTALGILFFWVAVIECDAKRLFTPIIETDKGQVQGEIMETILNRQSYYSFKGIPYASPPVGSLRFKPPIEAEPWTGIKQTITDGSPCVQVDEGHVIGSEDCLYLNVFSPTIDVNNLKAVIFVIHGGFYKVGGSFWFGPDFFIEEDVVFVAIQYRLGALGYLRLDHSDVLGNAGLKDQVYALRWVNKNIKKFGGDPERVMIYGLSSGAASVDLHIVSDLSEGLFHRSIADSGTILSPWAFSTPEEAKERAFALGAWLNNNKKISSAEELVSILQNAEATEIVLKTELFPQIRPFKPSVENPNISKNESKFLTECYIDKFLSGNYNKLPHIAQFAADESLYSLKSAQMFEATKRETYDYIKNYNPFSSIISEHIKNNTNADNYSSKASLRQLIDVLTKVNYVAATDLKQQIMTQTGTQPIYYLRYAFDGKEYSYHQIEANVTVLNGTGHADSEMVFDIPLQIKYKLPLKDHPVALKRSQQVRLYTNFAKYGNPTPHGVYDPLLRVTWPIAGINGAHLDFGDELMIKNYSPVDSKIKNLEEVILENLKLGSCCNSACELVATSHGTSLRPPNFWKVLTRIFKASDIHLGEIGQILSKLKMILTSWIKKP